jgi:SH3-like domain-containing protein
VGPAGATTWADAGETSVQLDAGLPVEATQQRGDWVRIRCSNGWEAWVDSRALVPMASSAPETTQLFRALSDALVKYRQAAEAAAAGRITTEEFRRQAVTIGQVVVDDELWLLDAGKQRWARYDGITITHLC